MDRLETTALPLWRRLLWRCLSLAWLWLLATVVGVAFRGTVNPSTTAFMQEKQQELAAEGVHGAYLQYQWVDYAHIAPSMRLAVVTAEDQSFPTHHGFDWDAIAAAMQHNAHSRHPRGASTLSQQTAKNLWLWPGHSYVRKFLEAYLTVLMEAEWPKRRILETYLNVAQFDDYTFGVGAAARQLFGKTPAQLSPEEAALLAAALPSPDRFDVADPSSYLKQRQAWILEQMQGLGTDYLDGMERPLKR